MPMLDYFSNGQDITLPIAEFEEAVGYIFDQANLEMLAAHGTDQIMRSAAVDALAYLGGRAEFVEHHQNPARGGLNHDVLEENIWIQ